MRLKEQGKIAITEAIHNKNSTVDIYLFGSWLDDGRKGGDIDLCVETNICEELLNHKARIRRKISAPLECYPSPIVKRPGSSYDK